MQKIYVDGSGDGRYCWINETNGTNKTYLEKGLTNNEAEYLAVLRALQENSGEIEILSDSKLVVNQLNGEWHIKEVRLRELFDKVQKVIKEKGVKATFTWIPREENRAGKYLG